MVHIARVGNASQQDKGTPHTETPHTGTPHTGTPHTGTPHTGTPHTGTPHTGTPHTRTPHFLPSSTSYTVVDNANIYVLVCHSEYKSSSYFFLCTSMLSLLTLLHYD